MIHLDSSTYSNMSLLSTFVTNDWIWWLSSLSVHGCVNTWISRRFRISVSITLSSLASSFTPFLVSRSPLISLERRFIILMLALKMINLGLQCLKMFIKGCVRLGSFSTLCCVVHIYLSNLYSERVKVMNRMIQVPTEFLRCCSIPL